MKVDDDGGIKVNYIGSGNGAERPLRSEFSPIPSYNEPRGRGGHANVRIDLERLKLISEHSKTYLSLQYALTFCQTMTNFEFSRTINNHLNACVGLVDIRTIQPDKSAIMPAFSLAFSILSVLSACNVMNGFRKMSEIYDLMPVPANKKLNCHVGRTLKCCSLNTSSEKFKYLGGSAIIISSTVALCLQAFIHLCNKDRLIPFLFVASVNLAGHLFCVHAIRGIHQDVKQYLRTLPQQEAV